MRVCSASLILGLAVGCGEDITLDLPAPDEPSVLVPQPATPVPPARSGVAAPTLAPIVQPTEIVEPIMVFGPQDGFLQGGDVHMTATDRGYIVVFQQNVRGRVTVMAQALDFDGKKIGPVVAVHDPLTELGNPNAQLVAWRTPVASVFWTTRSGKLAQRKLRSDGTPIAELHVVLDDISERATLRSIVATQTGYAMAWLDDRAQQYRYLPYFMGVCPEGRVTAPPVVVTEGTGPTEYPSIGALVAVPNGYALTWSERRPGRPDDLYLSMLDHRGTPRDDPTTLFNANNVIGGSMVASQDELHVALWELGSGLRIVNGSDRTAQNVAAPLELKRPILARTTDGHHAIFAQAGALRPSNPTATQVHFAEVDRSSGETRRHIHVNRAIGRTRCIEDTAMAKETDGAGFGVIWSEGCDERRIYFARIPN